MSASLERRARAIRSRAQVRRWEYRQRHLARGVWFLLRRFLTFAAEAYIVPDRDVDELLAEGYAPDPAGRAIEPPKVLLRVPRERLARIAARRAIPVNLGPELLAARAVVTVGFDDPPAPGGR